jgi:hypothetical protein
MRAGNPREHQGHEYVLHGDAETLWYEIPDLDIVGVADDEDEAVEQAEDVIDIFLVRQTHPERLPNIVVRKPEAEKFLRKKLRGRKTDYYVLSEPKNLGGPYGSMAQAKARLRQVEYFKRVKPGRRRNWTSSAEAAEYALKRWGHANYLAAAPMDQTWAQFAAFIRRTGDVGAEDAAAAIEALPGLPIDFPIPVEPIRPEHLPHFLRRTNRCSDAQPLSWHKSRRQEGLLAKGDYVSDELAPGIHYELHRREQWDVFLRHGDDAMRVSSAPDLRRAKQAAASDARDTIELAREIVGTKAANPADRWDLQTVIVDKSVAPTREAATEIAREFGKRIYTSRETKTSWRFRQRPPKDFVKETFRTRPIRGRGVSLVYGRLRRGTKSPTKRR